MEIGVEVFLDWRVIPLVINILIAIGVWSIGYRIDLSNYQSMTQKEQLILIALAGFTVILAVMTLLHISYVVFALTS